ncbi:MAG: DNA-binding protein [Erysipelotrichaceae bacterium]
MIRFADACGKAGKTIVARLLPSTDLIEGIEEVCKKNNVKHAYVSCFGSFSKTGYMYLVPKEDAKVGAGYGDVITVDGPVEFLNGTGVVCQNKEIYDIHFHATMCDKTGRVFGGHIVKGYTPTLTTVDLMILEIEDVEMLRCFDEETGLTQFLPTK